MFLNYLYFGSYFSGIWGKYAKMVVAVFTVSIYSRNAEKKMWSVLSVARNGSVRKNDENVEE